MEDKEEQQERTCAERKVKPQVVLRFVLLNTALVHCGECPIHSENDPKSRDHVLSEKLVHRPCSSASNSVSHRTAGKLAWPS